MYKCHRKYEINVICRFVRFAYDDTTLAYLSDIYQKIIKSHRKVLLGSQAMKQRHYVDIVNFNLESYLLKDGIDGLLIKAEK